MTDVRAPAGTSDSTAATGGLTVRRRRGLPNGRAVVGGLLIAVAAVGVFAAYTGAAAGPTTTYAVATRDLRPGDRAAPADFALVPMTLPDEQRRLAFDSTASMTGVTVLEPLAAGELVQAGSLVATGTEAGARSVSFAVDPARAIGGLLTAAERVDIVATFGSGDEACTALIAADVAVVAATRGNDSLGAAAAMTMTVQADSAQQSIAIAHAANAATVTLVRATGAPEADAEQVCSPSRARPTGDE